MCHILDIQRICCNISDQTILQRLCIPWNTSTLLIPFLWIQFVNVAANVPKGNKQLLRHCQTLEFIRWYLQDAQIGKVHLHAVFHRPCEISPNDATVKLTANRSAQMFVAIVGTRASGKASVAQYLVEQRGFHLVKLIVRLLHPSSLHEG